MMMWMVLAEAWCWWTLLSFAWRSKRWSEAWSEAEVERMLKEFWMFETLMHLMDA
jgi:hypothetical protein